MGDRRQRRIWTLAWLLSAAAAAAGAGTVEVVVRDRGGATVPGEQVFLKVVAAEMEDFRTRLRLHRGYLSAILDVDGKARFDELPAGTYAVGFAAGLRDPTLVRPSDNPYVTEPRVSLFEDDEHLQLEVELWRGIPVRVFLDLPDNLYSGFRAIFEHRETGLTMAAGFPEHDNAVERLLVPGVWEVGVVPKPGYLLVGLSRERLPLPGHSARIDLIEEPHETWLTWTYAAPCELSGSVVEESGRERREPVVHVEATLLEPGAWIEAARARGGSIYEEVVAAVDPRDGRYQMVLPDGRWRVRPAGPLVVASEPELLDLDLAPGAVASADFTVRLDDEAGEGMLPLAVFDRHGRRLPGAAVEVYDLEEPQTPLRSGVTGGRGWAALPAPPAGEYLVAAGHPDHLEGTLELRVDDPRKIPLARVVLAAGAEVRVEAFDAAGEPLADVEVTLERLGELPPLALRSGEFLAAKRLRTLTTDPAGRVAASGFYAGTYRARARLRGRAGSRGLIRLAVAGDRPRREPEVEISEAQRLDLEARLEPAASVAATLACSDGWSLPDTVDVRVVAGGGEPVLTLEGVALGGRGRDAFTAGPLEPGTYLLAVRPAGFERWTWAFETHDPLDATDLQVLGSGDGEIDLGQLRVDCGPTADLLPAIAGGADFPDLEGVEVEVRLLDPENGEERRRPPSLQRRGRRLLLRDFPPPAAPRGTAAGRPPLLEITLVHPHLLPAPVQRWHTDFELERGRFEELELEVEALGGAIAVVGEGALARLSGPVDGGSIGELRETPFEAGKAEIPSLVPGRYSLRIENASGELLKAWNQLEVRAGETLHLEHLGRPGQLHRP